MGQIIKYLIIAGLTIWLAIFLANGMISDPFGATTRRKIESRTAIETARLQSEAQTETACAAGASGVLVGRSVWKEAALMEAPERDEWLAGTGVARMQRLVDIVESGAVPWRQRSPLAAEPGPTEGWAAGYPGNPG